MEDNYRKTLTSFSNLIHQLYGDFEYRSVKSYLNPSNTKKYYLKILKSIKFAIEETIIVVDKNHKDELILMVTRCETSLKSAKKFDEIDQLMIAFQSNLILLLIGAIPRRWSKEKVINKRDIWKLDGFRQIQYVQNSEQKKLVIFKAVQGKYQSRFGDWSNFVSIYHKECNREPEKLIEWIKKNHSDIYLDLF